MNSLSLYAHTEYLYDSGIINPMRVRLLTQKDLPDAGEIVGLNYTNKYKKMAIGELNDMFGASSIRPLYYVVEIQKQVVGFGGYIQSMIDYGVYQMFWVNVHPNWQKRGVGKLLVSKIINEIKKKEDAELIILSADNRVGNQDYYKDKFDFRVVQEIEGGRTSLMTLSIK